MPTIRIQVRLGHVSALPLDAVSNTFHFDAPATTVAAGVLMDRLEDFYNDGGVAFPNLCNWLSEELSRNADACEMRAYNMDEPAPRVPFHQRTWTLGAGYVSEPLPGEVALCLSYEALRISGRNMARSRGRVYTGPYNIDSLTTGVSVSRPTTALRDALLGMGERLGTECAAAGTPWQIYSTAGGGSVTDVRKVWVDNAWDTQRRRGVSATDRDSALVPAAP